MALYETATGPFPYTLRTLHSSDNLILLVICIACCCIVTISRI